MARKRYLSHQIPNEIPNSGVNKRLRSNQPQEIVLDKSKGQVAILKLLNPREEINLIIQLSKLFKIGRSDRADYVIDSSAVSKIHCQVYAFQADTGETIVGLKDESSNGTMHNNRRLYKQSVILNDGDRIEIGNHKFQYIHHGESGVVGQSTQQQLQHVKESVGDYIVFDRLLGSGAYSVIRLALNSKSLKQVACKIMKASKLRKDLIKDVKREVKILKSLKHPNINQVEEVIMDSEQVYIFLQLLSGGDLFGYIIKHGRLSAAETKWIIFQLFKALDYLHSDRNIAHRDLKVENILLDGPGPFPKVLLADFGQARLSDVSFHSLTGTPIYMAPEALNAITREEGYDGKSADCWAIGCILCILLAGYHPFEDWVSESQLESLSASPFGESAGDIIDAKKDRNTCYNILRGTIRLGSEKFGSNNAEVRDLIHHLLAADPVERYTAKQALNHVWFKQSEIELRTLYATRVSSS